VSRQSDHRSERLPATRRRAACRDEAGSRHVRQDGRARSADAGRAATVSCRGVAEGLRDDSAARPQTKGTSEAWLRPRGGTLKPWIRVSQVLDYVAGVHPRFDRAKAEAFLAKTTIKRRSKVRELSKGMVAQLHLAVVMAIDARLLVLDEPTLGLDILYRKQFYDSLLNDYFDRNRTIVVATHQVEEVQHVLTDLMFMDRGRIVFDRNMEEVES